MTKLLWWKVVQAEKLFQSCIRLTFACTWFKATFSSKILSIYLYNFVVQTLTNATVQILVWTVSARTTLVPSTVVVIRATNLEMTALSVRVRKLLVFTLFLLFIWNSLGICRILYHSIPPRRVENAPVGHSLFLSAADRPPAGLPSRGLRSLRKTKSCIHTLFHKNNLENWGSKCSKSNTVS